MILTNLHRTKKRNRIRCRPQSKWLCVRIADL